MKVTNFPERVEVERFREIIARHLGLQFDDGKRDYLSDVLRQRVEETGCGQAAMYLSRLSSSQESRRELRALAERLTVAETYFFRNQNHFCAFTDAVLPAHTKVNAGQRQLRILSAGCASGEEAYSIAISLLQNISEIETWDIKILGIDVNPSMIERALRARYSAWALRDTDEQIKAQYFRTEGRDYKLCESIRSMVTFEERNLAEDDPVFWRAGAFDVVFCRNVTMYFCPEVTRSVVSRIGRALAPRGHLFLGHAETLRGISHDFHLCHSHDTFYYQRHEDFIPDETVPYRESSSPARPEIPPWPPEFDASWVEAIQRASERIACLARKPDQPSLANQETASIRSFPVHWNMGITLGLIKQERFADALESLRALPPEAQRDTDTQLLHAVLLTNAGRQEEAEGVCRRLLDLDEMNAGAHYLMALCCEHAGDKPSAAEHDHAAVYLDADFAMPHFHLGLMARRSGDLETARRELSNALTLILREDASRILLFGGGFSRDALIALCRSELQAIGGVL
ncbi:MAG: methyltransferase domain-containing protein [Planctomycetes bacterium]|nr:methyltransferase domain-containing protein [Planctomycetota bacterium]